MRIGLAALMLLAGCDRVFGLEAPHVCEPGTAFGAGTPVEIDGVYSVEAARFDPDQSVAYLSLCEMGQPETTCDLFQSVYVKATGELSAYVKLAVNSSTTYDSYGTITPDAQHLVFGSKRNGPVRTFISVANGGQFETATELKLIPNVAFANEPYLLGDGATLYLAGGQVGGTTGGDIYRARAGGPPTFGGSADLVEGVNLAGGEAAPVVSNDELEILFASDRESTGVPSFLPLDIFIATRATATDPFDTPTQVVNLSTPDGTDWPVWISPDRCDLYYINKVNNFATLLVAHR